MHVSKYGDLECDMSPETTAAWRREERSSRVGPRTSRRGVENELAAGKYFVELEIDRPCPPSALEAGLTQMGWEPIALDQSGTPKEPLRHVRFVAELRRPIQMIDLPELRWAWAELIHTDVFSDLQYGELEPHELKQGHTYELRFTARMKAHPSQKAVGDELIKMGFAPDARLVSLRRDMRVPDRPGTSTSLWFAIARWDGPDGIITVDDAFLFQDAYDCGLLAEIP